MRITTVFTLALTLLSLPLSAQQQLEIRERDIELLDLVFAPVEVAQQQVGINLPGRVVTSPDSISQSISLYDGILDRWHVNVGARIVAGDVLATVRSDDALTVQREYLMQRNELELAQQYLQRDNDLFEEGIISRRRLQETEAEHRARRLAVDASARLLRQAGLSGENLEQLATGAMEPGMLLLRAPVTGTLTHRAYNTGEHVPAHEVVATLAEDAGLWLSVEVPSRLSSFLAVGGKLTTLGNNHSLTLRQRDMAVDPASQTLEILAEFDEPVNLVPGQLQTVALHPQQAAIFVPSDAVVHEGSETVVYVRNADGVEVRSLQLIPVGNGYLAPSGINAGEQVLVRGTALVKGMQLGLGSDE